MDKEAARLSVEVAQLPSKERLSSVVEEVKSLQLREFSDEYIYYNSDVKCIL